MLERAPEEHKTKSTKALLGFVATSDANVLHTMFGGWAGVMIKTRHDRDFRKKFEADLIAKETLLIEMRKKALGSAAGRPPAIISRPNFGGGSV